MSGEPSEHSGRGGFLAGIAVLVVIGVAFAMVVDRKSAASKGRADLASELKSGVLQANKLKARIADMERVWKEKVQPFEGHEKEVAELTARAREDSVGLAKAKVRRDLLVAEIAAADTAFRSDRDTSRQKAWAAAAGEKLAELKVLGGKTYLDVTIKRVTAEGLEIQHADGISRIPPGDLDASWRERFQWAP